MTNKEFSPHRGFIFSKHIPEEISHFDRVFDVFKDLLTHTSGDIEEAFEWLDMLDKEYDIFDDEYSLQDFEEDLRKRGYIRKDDSEEGNSGNGQGKNLLTPKLEAALREYALDQIFGKLKKAAPVITALPKQALAMNGMVKTGLTNMETTCPQST